MCFIIRVIFRIGIICSAPFSPFYIFILLQHGMFLLSISHTFHFVFNVRKKYINVTLFCGREMCFSNNENENCRNFVELINISVFVKMKTTDEVQRIITELSTEYSKDEDRLDRQQMPKKMNFSLKFGSMIVKTGE